MRGLPTAVLLMLAVGVAAGCAAQPPAARPRLVAATPTRTANVAPHAAADCPKLARRERSMVTIDYVDFLQAGGRNYIADLHPVAPITRADLGTRVLSVRCSYARLNHETGRQTPPPRDGDAAFLQPGTPVYAIHGWSPSCRLAASWEGRLRVYLAYQPHAAFATPEACALRRTT